MSYEVIQRVGKYQYIFLAKGYRDQNGKVRQKRVPVGKVEPETGRKICKPEYLAQNQKDKVEADSPLSNEEGFSIDDVRHCPLLWPVPPSSWSCGANRSHNRHEGGLLR